MQDHFKSAYLPVVPALVTALLCIVFATPEYVSAREESYQLVISKTDKQLHILQGRKKVKSFSIAVGRGGKGTKQRLGDNKTPIGVYKITDFKADSKFHYFMQIDYPNLLDAWYGYKNNIISAMEFKNIAFAFKRKLKPPQDTDLGGYIGIHGLGETTDERLKIHESMNWTEGCIALKNSEINSLRQYVSIGTRVTIQE